MGTQAPDSTHAALTEWRKQCCARDTSQVLLLDEITVDLDVLGRADMLAFLESECEERGATIIYVRLLSTSSCACRPYVGRSLVRSAMTHAACWLSSPLQVP